MTGIGSDRIIYLKASRQKIYVKLIVPISIAFLSEYLSTKFFKNAEWNKKQVNISRHFFSEF